MATPDKLTTEGCGCADTNVHTDYASGPGSDSSYYPQVPVDYVGDYDAWGTVTKSFGAASGNWQGQFNSYLQAGSGWLIGYLDESNVPYTSDLSELDCDDVLPNIVYVSSGVIGYNTASTPGYYNYTSPGAYLNIFRLIILYKYCDDNTVTIYVIKVTDLQSIPNGDASLWTSEVDYSYRCFSCSQTRFRKPQFEKGLVQAFLHNQKVVK